MTTMGIQVQVQPDAVLILQGGGQAFLRPQPRVPYAYGDKRHVGVEQAIIYADHRGPRQSKLRTNLLDMVGVFPSVALSN